MNRLKLLAMAALLVVPLAACEETTSPPPTGTISGNVSVEGGGLDGVTVTLSSGQSVTTSGGGNYSFPNVEAGTYTVEISGFPADASFPSTSKSAVITTAGQTATVDFSGSYIRTSAIIGQVTGAGTALVGVSVSLSGTSSASTTTDAGGLFSFSGLRAGSYTVSIAGFDAVAYSFASTSQSVSVGAGQTQVVNFSGTENRTASISGFLYLDENPKNNMYEGASLEDLLEVAGIQVTLQGPDINDSETTETDATGNFLFDELVAGSYNVILDTGDADIPASVAFGGASSIVQATVTAGSSASVSYPFDITAQTVNVYAVTGFDGGKTGAPVAGVDIDLYPTQAAANALTGAIGSETTDATGLASFTFDRVDDTGPAGVTDFIVFSVVDALNNNDLGIQADSAMEISYSPRSFTAMAPDSVDILNGRASVSVTMNTIVTSIGGGIPEAGWNTAYWLNDTTATTTASGVTDASGMSTFTDGVAVASLPDTFYIRLSGAQPAAIGQSFSQTPEPSADAAVSGQYITYIHDGTAPIGSTIDLGTLRVKFTTQAMLVSVYHETDDSLVTPIFTGGDNLENVDNVSINLWKVSNDMTDTTVVATTAAAAGTGDVVFGPLATDSTWLVSAFSTVGTQTVLTDTVASAQGDAGGGSVGGFGDGVGGFRHSARVCPLSADTVIASCKTFAFKYNNTIITGVVRAADGTDADGLPVTITPTADNIQPGIVDTTLFVSGGAYTMTGLIEGPYDVSVGDSAGVWGFPSGGNTASAELEGSADDEIVNFTPTYLNTTVSGLVANDRDADGVTLDPNEALAGVVLDIWDISDATMTSLGTSTTDAGGAFTFGPLPEATYVVQRQAMTPDNNQIVLRGFTAGAAHDTAVVTTTAGAPDATSVGLPKWNYPTSTVDNSGAVNFTFLFANTTARGTATSGGSPIGGLQIFMRRCQTSAGAASPPVAGTCTSYFPGVPASTSTAADGTWSFSGLQEGIYEVAPNPPSVGLTTSTPASRLFLLVDTGDIEEGSFIIS